MTVVLPASMWAMMPMLRVRARDTWRGMFELVPNLPWLPGLPLEVAEGLVRLGHLVRVFAALDRGADAIHGIDQLSGELL